MSWPPTGYLCQVRGNDCPGHRSKWLMCGMEGETEPGWFVVDDPVPSPDAAPTEAGRKAMEEWYAGHVGRAQAAQ